MFFLMVIINIVSTFINWGGDLQVPAVISLVCSLWVWGIATNFSDDTMQIPNYAVMVSMISGLAGIIMAVIGAVS